MKAKYSIVKRYTVHTPALARKSTYLTKCEEVVGRDKVVFERALYNCDACLAAKWPSKASQKAFDSLRL